MTRGSVRPPAACCAATGSMIAAITPSTGSDSTPVVDGRYGVVSVEVGPGGVEPDVGRDLGVGAGGDRLVGDAEGLARPTTGPPSPSCRR